MKNEIQKNESNIFGNIFNAISDFFELILNWINEAFGNNSTETSSKNNDTDQLNEAFGNNSTETSSKNNDIDQLNEAFHLDSTEEVDSIKKKVVNKRQSIVKIEELKDRRTIESNDLDSAANCFVSDYIENGIKEGFFEVEDERKFKMIKKFIENLAKQDSELKGSEEVSRLFDENPGLKEKIIEKCNEFTRTTVDSVNQFLENPNLTDDSLGQVAKVLKEFLENEFKNDEGCIDNGKICSFVFLPITLKRERIQLYIIENHEKHSYGEPKYDLSDQVLILMKERGLNSSLNSINLDGPAEFVHLEKIPSPEMRRFVDEKQGGIVSGGRFAVKPRKTEGFNSSERGRVCCDQLQNKSEKKLRMSLKSK